MSNAPPWKVAVIGAVAVTAGCKLLVVDWTLAQLTAFVAMLFIARGALHIVTTSFDGMPGALSLLLGLGEIAVGMILLVWPAPTLLTIVVVVGVWTVGRAITITTNLLATRREHPQWRILLVPAALELVLGGLLFSRASGSVRDVAVVIGVVMIVEGAAEFLMAIDAKRRGRVGRGALVAS